MHRKLINTLWAIKKYKKEKKDSGVNPNLRGIKNDCKENG